METPLLICVRVADMDIEPAEGSAQLTCTECGAPIWVARSSQSMLQDSEDCRLVCMHCATEITKAAPAAPEPEQSIPAQIARLQSNAEAAYGAMYRLHDDREIRWQFELADDLLREAAQMAAEAALPEQAERLEGRRKHIRQIYYHQFVQPPHLLM